MPEEKTIKPISPEVSPQPTPVERPLLEEEQIIEKKEEAPTKSAEAAEFSVPVVSKSVALPSKEEVLPLSVTKKSEELQAIEEILEENLEEAYWQMPPAMRQQFKEQGEDTAKKIERLLNALHLNILKVLRLLQKWLSIIPHINSFFLEQEAKIKADKIIALHRERNKPQ
ncbi:MAG: hypothetical protein Q7S16_00460 [bacterium]|nr:hypothetical protein [bacterium]